MTTIRTAGEAWAAGLTWHLPLSARKLRRAARAAGAVAWIETAAGTGLAGDDDGDPTDTPSLAVALLDHIADPSWIAVVDGGDGRVAMVRVESGAIGDDGDIVLDSATEAIRLLADVTGYRIHASPSLGISGAEPLDLARITIAEHHRLQPIPDPAGGGIASIVAATAFLAMVAVAAATLWIYRQAIIDYFYPPPPEPVAQVEQERQVVAMISTPALLQACAAALREVPPGLPGWTLVTATCQAELVEAPVLAVAPKLQGLPALVLTWSLGARHDSAIHRRLIDDLFIATRHAGLVKGREALAVTALAPVVIEVDPAQHRPDFRTVRAALDRRVGPWADTLSYAQLQPGQWSVTITGRGPLRRLAAALAPIAGLEVTSLRRTANGVWNVSARPLVPRTLLESAYLRLATPAVGLYDAGTGLHEGGS